MPSRFTIRTTRRAAAFRKLLPTHRATRTAYGTSPRRITARGSHLRLLLDEMVSENRRAHQGQAAGCRWKAALSARPDTREFVKHSSTNRFLTQRGARAQAVA